jgi:hypothetical protein
LNDTVREYEVEGVVREWEALAVGDEEFAGETLLREIGLCEIDRGPGQIHAGHMSAALGEPGQVDSRPAADLQDRPAAIAVEVDEPQQMVQLFEMVLIEIVEESA